MFKKGDVVRFLGGSEGVDCDLTVGRVYEVKDVTDDMVLFLDDAGDERYRPVSRFELVKAGSLYSIDTLIPLIHQWGVDRGILENSTPIAQSRKTIEEVHEMITACGELRACLSLNQGPYENDEEYRTQVIKDLTDAIGDVFVTLVMVAGCAKLDITKCVAAAYDEIKDRTGYLRPDGVFVKEKKSE